jgi:hypothetical protein
MNGMMGIDCGSRAKPPGPKLVVQILHAPDYDRVAAGVPLRLVPALLIRRDLAVRLLHLDPQPDPPGDVPRVSVGDSLRLLRCTGLAEAGEVLSNVVDWDDQAATSGGCSSGSRSSLSTRMPSSKSTPARTRGSSSEPLSLAPSLPGHFEELERHGQPPTA